MSHARLSPSNTRWPICPGSIEACKDYPNVTNSAAIDGTGTHLLLELCVEQNLSPTTFIEKTIGVGHSDMPEGWTIDAERADRVQMVINYIKRRKTEIKKVVPGAFIEVKSETRVNPGALFGRDDWYGTGDVILTATDEYWRTIFIEVIDLKDGRLFVGAENNTQLRAYGLGACAPYLEYDGTKLKLKDESWDFNVRVTIVQPKGSTPVRYEDLKLSAFVHIGHELHRAACQTDYELAPLVSDGTGKGHCRWCPHRDNCPQLKSDMKKSLDKIPALDLLRSANIHEAPAEQLSEILDAKAQVDAIFKQVEEEAQRRIEDGQEVPGYGMVPGNTIKSWCKDEKQVEKMLKNRGFKAAEIWSRKLSSPAAIVKSARLNAEQKEFLAREYIAETCKTKFGKVKKREFVSAKELFKPSFF